MREQLIRRCAFRAKIALTDRTFRIAFDRNKLPAFVINELPATDSAVWTNRSRYLRIVDSRMHSTFDAQCRAVCRGGKRAGDERNQRRWNMPPNV